MTHQKATKVTEKILYHRVVKSERVSPDVVVNWFPKDERNEVENLIENLIEDENVPITRYGWGKQQGIHITGVKSAIEYLNEHGGDAPYGFEGLLD